MLLHQLICLLLIMLTNGNVLENCPLILVTPSELLVEYGKSIAVTCKPVTNSGLNIIDIGWNVSSGSSLNSTRYGNWNTKLEVHNLTDCESEIKCYLMTPDLECYKKVSLTVYKLPDSVSLRILNHNGFLIEGSQYALKCDIEKMAAENFNVNWYEGETLLSQTSSSRFNRNPISHSDIRVIKPTFPGSDYQYRCETELKVGSEYIFKTSSSPLSIEVKDCFAILEPPAVVVEYGSSVSARCSSDILNIELGWEAPLGAEDWLQRSPVTWSVDHMNLWEINPICFYTNNVNRHCRFELPVTVYKLPDSVSISFANYSALIVEDTEYELQCIIQNVFSNNFTVMWYRENILIYQKRIHLEKSELKNPVNFTNSFYVSFKKDMNGIQFRCKVELDLRPEAPHPPPSVTSLSLNISVHYGPTITQLSSNISANDDTDVPLHCYADGNPEPEVTWSFENQTKFTGRKNTTLIIFRVSSANAGEYTCTATNKFGSDTRTVRLNVAGRSSKAMFSPFLFLLIIPLLLIIGIMAYCCYRFKKYTGHYNAISNGIIMSKVNHD